MPVKKNKTEEKDTVPHKGRKGGQSSKKKQKNNQGNPDVVDYVEIDEFTLDDLTKP